LIGEIFSGLVRFILLVLVQVLIINHIELGPSVNPNIYILFLLLLPYSTPAALVLTFSFATGITMDMFMNTGGMHAAACVAMGYARILYLRTVVREEEERYEELNLSRRGLRWFFIYCLFMVFIHHFVLFFVEVFTFEGFLVTMQRVVFSSAVTLFLIILEQFLFLRFRSDNE
jgi:hypothetical protein